MMPFDAAEPPIEVIYQERRERAAAFWRTIPTKRFDLTFWSCDSAACALGWLANSEFEGWRWSWSNIPLGPDKLDGIEAAATFFGLADDDAMKCFAANYSNRKTRPSTVANRLLSMPITIQA